MKKAKLFLAFLAVLTLSLVLAVIPAAADEGTVDTEGVVTYDGLQARTKGDYMGLRSLYTVDNELVEELVTQGHTVQYGALMGIGAQRGITYLSLADMTLTVGEAKITADSSLANAVVVYDSTGIYDASGIYVSQGDVKSRFAYTTTYKPAAENALMLKETELIYRAFLIVDGVVTYVDATGPVFGTETSTYGAATSLREVADYWSGIPAYENNPSLRKIIASCMDSSFTKEFDGGVALTTNVANCTVTVPAIKAGVYAVKMNYVHPTANSGYRFTVKNTTTGEIAHAKMPINTSGDGTTPAWSASFIYLYLREGENVLQIAADSAVNKLYGIELTQVLNTPVEDTYAAHVTTANTSFWYNGENIGTPYNDKLGTGTSQKTNLFNKHSAGNMYFVRTGVTAKHTLSVNATATYDLYILGTATGTTVTATVSGQTKTASVPATYVAGAGTQSITSEGSGTNLIKIGSFNLEEGENLLEITNGFFVTFGSIVAVRQAEDVVLYDADGKTALSTQKVYDIADVVYPTNVKIPAGYDDVSGWTPLIYNEETGCYESQIIYGKYYTVSFYDYDTTTLLSTMRIVAGSETVGPDMSGDKTFKCWSTPLSEINSDCSVYAVKKQQNASVSASDAILASASFTKVAEDATYSGYNMYYDVVATEADGFVAGEVYTKDGDSYHLAFTDTGDTYYTLSVTPIVATEETVVSDYYAYTYTMAEDSPIKTVSTTFGSRMYAPETTTTDAAFWLVNSGTMEHYVTVRVYVDYTGLYKLSLTGDTAKMVSWYGSVRNMTTAAKNPNIESYMTNRFTGFRIGTSGKGLGSQNVGHFLSKGKTSTATAGYLYLAEGWNEIKLTQEENSNNSRVLAATEIKFTLQRTIDEGGAVVEKYTSPASTTHVFGQNNAIAAYTRYQNVSLPQTVIDQRTVTVNAGAYNIYFFGCDSGGTLEYTFTHKETGEAVTVSLALPSQNGGHSYSAHVESLVGTVTLPYDGAYSLTVKLTKLTNYASFALIRLAPIVGETHTVKFYDGDGNLLSIQSVADGAAAVAPEIHAENFLGWSEDFSSVTADMEIYATYDIRYTVNYYDDNEVLIKTESIMKGSAANPPDYATFAEFRGWSTSADEYIAADLSQVTGNMDVYFFQKQKNASVSASDVILASASFTKVAEGATYSDFEGYYTVVATEADGFVAGAVYTKDGDTYNLALTDTGDTYYALTVTPVVATSSSTLTDYYTYTYTIADDSPVKTVAATEADNFYTPATATTTDAIYFPNASGIKPSTTYVSVLVTVDYTGYYRVDIGTSKMYSHYPSLRNVTTESQNPNIEAFMTNRASGSRISGTKVTGNKANALFAAASKSYNMGYIYLAEGVNEIRLYHNYHSNNGTGSAFSSVDFTLLREHDAQNSLAFEITTSKAGWYYSDVGNDTASPYGSGQGFIRVQPQSTKNQNMPYDFIANKTLDTEKTAQVNNAAIPEGATLATRAVTLKAGTYRLVEYINSSGHKISYTFTKADDTSVSVTASSNVTSANPGHSFSAFMEVAGPTVTIPEDGTYNVSVVGIYAQNYISFAMFHLVPVVGETHTVTFTDTDGSILSKQTVVEGASAVAPDMSGDDGFLYWDTDFSKVTGDLTVTAVRKHTVTFRTHDGNVIDVRTTVTGGTVTAPEAPLRDGYYFTGWSKDLENVRSDLSVRATYKEKESFTVTFVDRFGETIDTQTAYTGDAVTPPAYTAPDGYLFLGWSDDTSAVFENMTVTARTAATTLTGENLVGTNTTTVAAVAGTSLETIFLPVGDANYITFNVTADIAGYYALNLQMNNGGALLDYVRVKNTSATTYEKNYYGVGRVNSGSSKASVTVDNCMVAEGTAYTNDILHVFLHAGENTLHLSTNKGKSVGVSGITLTLKSGTTLDGDYYAIYDKNSFIAAESNISAYEGMSSGNDGQTGGYLLRTNRYVTLSETLTVAEDGFYSLHGVMAAGDAIVTLTDVNDPENVVVFNAASLGNKGGTASSAFWHGTRGTQNIFAGEYKVKIYSKGNHVFTAYYLTREGDLDGVYNVNTENAILGTGVERLENGVSVLLPGTEAGYIELPVTADRDGLFRVTLAASTKGAEIGALYATVNGGRVYTLSPAAFGITGDGYLNTEFNDEEDSVFYLPLVKGENTVRFYTGDGEKIAIAGARFSYAGSAADSTPYTGEALTVAGVGGTASVLGAGTATKNADHMYLTSTLYSNGGIATYTFMVDSPRSVYFNVNMEASLGSVILYTLKDSAGNTLKDTFYAVNHDTVGVECVNLDLFDFPAAGEYTLTVSLRRSQTNNKDSAANSLESSEIGAKVELRIYSIVFANLAQSLLPPDAESGDVTHSSVTGATNLGAGASMTFNNVSLRNNASYALRILGRVSPDAVVTVSYTGAGNILESDYFYDQLFKVTAVTEIPENNTTVYEYDTRTGRYVLATAYNADTVYYLKSGTVTPSSGSVTFTASEAITATQWIKLGNLNLLADTYTVTVTVTAGSLVVDDMLLVRTADYLHVIELDRSEISTTDENEVRTAVLSDNHYVHGAMGGYSDLERQYLMMEMLLAEYNTAESLDAVFLAGDLGNFRLNAETTIDNGKVYHYSMTYLIENVLRQMADTGLPFFATHSGHDYASSEMWYDLFGYEKNYVVVIDGAAYVCLDFYYDQADHKAHEPAAAQVDISDEVRDQILAVLDRDDVEYASIVIHYGTNSLPNINKIAAHEKMKVSFGGHTHDNTTQMEVGKGLSTSAMGGGGLLFLQHAHFSIVSGYDTGGKTLIDPIINLTNEGYYQVFSNVAVASEVYTTLSEIGLEYANAHETTKLASGNYSKSGRWQTAAYTVDGKKIIFFRDDILVEKKDYAQIAYNYYVIDGDNVYAADLSQAVSETFQVTYTGTEATDKTVNGLVYGVDYFKVGMANGLDVIVFPDSFDTTKGNYNVTTTGKTYYLVNADGSLTLLSGVTVAPHTVAAENRVISETHTYNNKTFMGYEVSGNPWGMRILERVNGTETDVLESYYVYGGYAFDGTYLGYMRIRPTDMAGYIDHLYVLVDFLDKN